MTSMSHAQLDGHYHDCHLATDNTRTKHDTSIAMETVVEMWAMQPLSPHVALETSLQLMSKAKVL